MQTKQVVLRSALLASVLAGCFEEGGQDAQQQAIGATTDGLLAFPEVIANVTTDAAAAGDALTKFLKTPIAADQLLSPPFQLTPGSELARRISTAPADLPGCVTTAGNPGCEDLTAAQCVAGAFSFDGSGHRTCDGCPASGDVAGECQYEWGSVRTNETMVVGFSDPEIGTATATTSGSLVVNATTLAGTVTFAPFELRDKNDQTVISGAIELCTCGAMTVSGGSLVDSQFVVKDVAGPRCAMVSFDASGVASAQLRCSCLDNTTCAD